MNKVETTEKNFADGCNCCQAVFLSYASDFGIDEKTALRLSSNFGGGFSKMREMCGAVSGMTMVAGLAKGYDDIKDPEAKSASYDLGHKLITEFKERNGALSCKELLKMQEEYKKEGTVPGGEPFNEKRPCTYLVKCAAEILEKEVFKR